ncbi:MAG: hypothetical protein JRG86_20420 [Deltaproteobacteria bacterium]|jgi:hypothetical protein|nr:hypothetical protein [Deltaproteobacteria bacterium]
MGGIETWEQDGHLRIERLLSDAQLETIRAEMEPHFGVEGWGRNEFEGRRTERVYSLPAQCPSVATLVEHPRILAILDGFLMPSRLLAACQGMRIHPWLRQVENMTLVVPPGQAAQSSQRIQRMLGKASSTNSSMAMSMVAIRSS